MQNPAVAKGEVWVVHFSDGEGHEQEGARPAVIMGDSPHFQMAAVIPATSQKTSTRFPFTYSVNSSKLNGLEVDSVFLVPQIRSVSKTRLLRKMGVLEDKDLKQLDSLVRDLLKLDAGSSSQPI